jgi:integrase
MNTVRHSTGDCKSSIIGSIPIRASKISCGKNFTRICNYVTIDGVDTPVTISDNGKFVSLKFTYKGNSHTQRLYVPLAQLTGLDIETIVKKFTQKIDGFISLRTLLDFYLEHGTGSLTTRKKNVANFIDYCKREGISLDEPISILAKTDELGRTLPERWETLYNLPHKLRQVRSIFGRKNLVLFKREGWDTSVFGNFSSFIPETTVSQPFSTSDIEVDHIINFFNAAKEEHPTFYKIYLLAFGCGLRKSEIYQVKHEDFTTFNGQHFLLLPFATKRTKLKNLNGVTEKVPVSQQVFEFFTSQFSQGKIVEGGERLHKRFIKFLKTEVGINENKACHRLRKILGARLATEHGIYHAAKQLRNSVQVAERYYSDLTAHKNELTV